MSEWRRVRSGRPFSRPPPKNRKPASARKLRSFVLSRLPSYPAGQTGHRLPWQMCSVKLAGEWGVPRFHEGTGCSRLSHPPRVTVSKSPVGRTRLPCSRRGDAVIGIALPNDRAYPLLDAFPLNSGVRWHVGDRAGPARVVGWIQLHCLTSISVSEAGDAPDHIH